MKKSENIALIDMDGTIADYDGGIRTSILPFLSEKDRSAPIWGDGVPGHVKRLIRYIKMQNGFWKNLPVIDSGIKVMKALQKEGFNLHILTKGPFVAHNAWTEKVQWCEEKLNSDFGELGKDYGISITSDKGLIYGRILFDDYIPYCERWLEWRPRGLVIQLQNDNNKGWSHPNVVQYNGSNFEEICERIRSAKER